MFHLITGGSGSGKSEYAEQMVCRYHQQKTGAELIYIATMYPYGEETQAKIKRHQQMRAEKMFTTRECYTGLTHAARELTVAYKSPSVLLECISNLTANELYMENGAGLGTADSVLDGIKALAGFCRNVVVVTNEVNSAGPGDNEEMRHYRRVIGQINCRLARMADKVTEVVYGIAVEVKG